MTIKETIKSWTDEAKKDLIQNYITLGLRASGNWEKDLESKVEPNGLNYKIIFLGSSYTQQMVSGRRPNQNKNSIRAFVGWAGSTFLKDWVEQKGIQANPYAIAYKIAREGIKVPNQFNKGTLTSDIFTDERIDRLLKSILGTMAEDIKTDLIRNFR